MSELAGRLAALSPERRALLLARLREQSSTPVAAGAVPPPAGAPSAAPPPLSSAQRRLWFLARLAPDSPAYNVPGAARLRGALAVASLRRALGEVLRRHEALRTTFAVIDGEPVQLIAAAGQLPLAVLDLAALPAAAAAATLARALGAEARRPFDLTRGPLVRALLVRLAAHEHVLMLNKHHIVSDGWSIAILLHELATSYAAYATGRVSRLPEPVPQYGEFARRQELWLASAECAGQLAYWRRQLTPRPAPTELPADRQRPAAPSFRGGRRRLRLDGLDGELRSLGSRRGATLFMTVLAAFAVVLRRLTGDSDLVLGTVIANRNRPEVERLLGCVANSLVLRLAVPTAVPFESLVTQAREVALAAYAHQDLPFDRLVDDLEPVRELGRSPLFQVMLEVHTRPPLVRELPGLRLETIEVPTGAAKLDAIVSLEEGGDGLAGSWQYAADLFDATTIERWAGHLRAALAGAVAQPAAMVDDLPVLGEAERQALTVEWSGGVAAAAAAGAAADLVGTWEEQAARAPDAIALVAGADHCTYGELNAGANRLARHLRQLGVGDGDLVGLLLDRSLDQVLAILAVLKAAAAYVPLDPAYPAARLRQVLADTGAPVVVSQARAAAALAAAATPAGSQPERTALATPPAGEPAHAALATPPAGEPARLVRLDDDRAAIGLQPASNPGLRPGGGSLAYVIHTSGSSGRPKGVLVTHGQVLRLFTATRRQFGFGAADVWTLFHSFTFDFSVWELWGALLHGGRLVVVPYQVSRSPADFLRLLDEQDVTVLNQTPSAFRQLLAAGVARRGPALRQVIFGGEALEPGALAPWWGAERAAAVGGTTLVNMYGITETTVHVTWHRLRPDTPAAAGSRIGVPIADLAVYVVAPGAGPAGGLAPVGAVGELAVGGAGVAVGYLGQPAATAERFVPDPWSGVAGARLYLSGDLGRWLPAGELEYHGRADAQLKVRGFRIEPGEIEAALAAHPGVAAAAVVGRAGSAGEPPQLVAYLVPRGDGAPRLPAAAELREHLGRTLPDHMVPALFAEIDALPLTVGGKLDRRRLAATAPAGRLGAAPAVAPRGALEQLLARTWEEVLGAAGVGALDHFFELGGDSIRAAVLANRLQESLGEAVAATLPFTAPRLAEMAAALAERHPAAVDRLLLSAASHGLELCEPSPAPSPHDAAGPAPIPVGCEVGETDAGGHQPDAAGCEVAPLSFGQERLWLVDRLSPGLPTYNLPLPLRLTGELDAAALRGALEEVVRRHGALRTTFRFAGQPQQVVGRPAAWPLPLVDLAALPPPAVPPEAHRLLLADALRPFDLERGPVMRTCLVRLGARYHLALVSLHHIAGDGWSAGLLVREVTALYQAFAAGRPSPLAAPPLQYAAFARWQRRVVAGETLAELGAFWRARLQGGEPLALPIDRPRPAVRGFQGARRHGSAAVRAASLRTGLAGAGRQAEATLFMTLLAALQALLARCCGQTLIAVGSPAACRNRRQLEGVVGFFANLLVLRTDLDGDPRFVDLVARVREAALAAYAHQEMPFEKLVELGPRRDLSRHPLFDVAFQIRDLPPAPPPAAGLTLTPVEPETRVAKFDLKLVVGLAGDGIEVAFDYSTDLFDPATAARLLAHFESLLAAAAAAPGSRLSELPLLSAPERFQTVREWNDSASRYPAGSTVPELFAAVAAQRPEAVALEHGDRQWTYGELERRSGRLAGQLARLGIGGERTVAICARRSPEMVAGLLGILRAGAVYVPLDPGHPPARLAELLKVSGARALLAGGGLAASLPAAPAGIAVLDLSAALGSGSEPPAALDGAPDRLAYVVFTSGSTGEPKGVAVPHRAVVRLVLGAGYARFGPAEVFLQLSPVAFDASTFEIWGSLLHGGRLVIPEEERPSLAALAALLARRRISTLFLTSALFQQLADAEPESLAAVPQVLTGGDVLAVAQVEAALASRRTGTLIHAYGPTENTTFTSCRALRRGDALGAVVPLGRAIDNGRIYVLDEALRPVAVGVAGELCAAGDGLARGYWARPDLTAASFVPDPLGAPGTRMYRTGDRVRWRHDGTMEFLGRRDGQVKIRGFRVEPGEIEAALGRHPGVAAAAVMAVPGQAAGERRLVAYLVRRPGGGGEATAAALRGLLRELLPAYCMPASWIWLDRLPLTPNGKLDRRALPALAAGAGERDETRRFVAPAGPVESDLAGMWHELLGAARVGAEDDFFDLGGHSLLATQLVTRIRGKWGVELPLRAVFENPTVAALAAALGSELAAAAGGARLAPIARAAAPLGDLDRMMADLERLTEEEAEGLLARAAGGAEEDAAGLLAREAGSAAVEDGYR